MDFHPPDSVMHLAILIVVVAAVAISENAQREAVAGLSWRLSLTVGAMAIVAIFAWSVSRNVSRGLRQDYRRRKHWLQLFDLLRQIHALLWISGTLGVMISLDWARIVRFNWGLDGFFLFDDLLILAPALFALLISWAAFYEVERTDQLVGAAIRSANPPRGWRGRYLWLRIRHDLGLILAPALLIIAIQDTMDFFWPPWREAKLAWLLYAGGLGLLIVTFPFFLRRLWRTQPLPPGPLRKRLTGAARRAGVQVRDILVWRTDGTMINAAVVGVTPWLRYLLLTDGLLARLNADELEAVVLHEAAHLKRGHLLIRGLVVLLPVWLCVFWQSAYPQTSENLLAMVESLGGGELFSPGLVGPLCFALYAVIALGWCSRMLEHDADLWACFAGVETGQEQIAPQWMIGAMRKLSPDASETESSWETGESWSWLHPSMQRRIDLIHQSLRQPKMARRYRTRVNWVSLILLGVALVGPLLLLLR